MNGYKAGSLEDGPYDAVAYLVPHKQYVEMGTEAFVRLTREGGVIYDLKGLLEKVAIEKTGRKYLAL